MLGSCVRCSTHRLGFVSGHFTSSREAVSRTWIGPVIGTQLTSSSESSMLRNWDRRGEAKGEGSRERYHGYCGYSTPTDMFPRSMWGIRGWSRWSSNPGGIGGPSDPSREGESSDASPEHDARASPGCKCRIEHGGRSRLEPPPTTAAGEDWMRIGSVIQENRAPYFQRSVRRVLLFPVPLWF